MAAPIALSPVTDTGFRDSVGATSATTGQVTGCFPNQLYGATLGPGGRLYIPAVCASPRGPTGPVTGGGGTNNIRTQVHSVLFVVDTAMGAEVPRSAGCCHPRASTRTTTPHHDQRRRPTGACR